MAQEHQSQLSTRFISIDLVYKKFKIWSPNFDACVLTKKNPFTMHNLHKSGIDKEKAQKMREQMNVQIENQFSKIKITSQIYDV